MGICGEKDGNKNNLQYQTVVSEMGLLKRSRLEVVELAR